MCSRNSFLSVNRNRKCRVMCSSYDGLYHKKKLFVECTVRHDFSIGLASLIHTRTLRTRKKLLSVSAIDDSVSRLYQSMQRNAKLKL